MSDPSPTHRIAIFRAGRHIAMSGLEREYTREDLAAAAAAYDPAVFEAPVVVGHPETNTPAFGWVKRLALDGDTLFAEVGDLDPAFVAAVQAGRYKKISAAFYLPEATSNPAPGALYLRHVGFLGGQAPAVKGLPAVSFAAGDYAEIDAETDFAAFGQAAHVTPAPSGAPSKEISMSEHDQAAYAEAVKERDALAAEAARLKAELDQLREQHARRERQIRHDANAAFCDGLVAQGRLPAGVKPVLVATLDVLGEGDQPVAFGEGDTAQPLATALREALSGLPQLADFGEHATGQAKTTLTRAEFDALSPSQRAEAVKAGVRIV